MQIKIDFIVNLEKFWNSADEHKRMIENCQ